MTHDAKRERTIKRLQRLACALFTLSLACPVWYFVSTHFGTPRRWLWDVGVWIQTVGMAVYMIEIRYRLRAFPFRK